MVEVLVVLVVLWATGGSWPLALLALAPTYLVTSWWWPFAWCACCRGTGKHYRAGRRSHRPCALCDGRGERWKVGARLWARGRER